MATNTEIQKFVHPHHGFIPKTACIAHVREVDGVPTLRGANRARHAIEPRPPKNVRPSRGGARPPHSRCCPAEVSERASPSPLGTSPARRERSADTSGRSTPCAEPIPRQARAPPALRAIAGAALADLGMHRAGVGPIVSGHVPDVEGSLRGW
jgi:hypothetical protein